MWEGTSAVISENRRAEMASVIFCIDSMIKRVLWKNSPRGRELPSAICPPRRIPANPLMQTWEWIIRFLMCSFWKDFPGLLPCVLDSEPRGERMKLFPHGRRAPRSSTSRRFSCVNHQSYSDVSFVAVISSKDHDNSSKMFNIWTKTTVALHTSVTLKRQMFTTHAFFSRVTHTPAHTHTYILMSICPLYRDNGSCFVIWSRHQCWSHVMTSDLSRGVTNTWRRHTFGELSLTSTDFSLDFHQYAPADSNPQPTCST